MIGSELYEPLPGRAARRRALVSARLVVAALGLAVLGAATFVVVRDDGNRGEPFAVGTIGPAEPRPPRSVDVAAPTAPWRVGGEGGSEPAQPQAAANIVDTDQHQQVQLENGVMVIRPANGGATGPVTLKVPDSRPTDPARLPDPRLIESTAVGPLPKIARDGLRPAQAYAAAPVAGGGKPRIAILVGGMGLDRQATTEAERQLPSAVTFGFAPYGDDLGEQVGRARASGREVVLQMPMEDYGQAEHSLSHMLEVGDADNPARLHWLMSRFAGYAGVGNYLGGRLLGDEATLRPLLKDIASRGLYFVDDGTSARSLAQPVARDLALPALKADVVLDARPDAASIALALSRLEKLARERGFAFGSATGRPETNMAIGRFLAEAGSRGIVVVPLSQAVGVRTADAQGTTSAEARR